MEIFDYTGDSADGHLCPFRGRYESDFWIAYHGTSDRVEGVIDTEGFGGVEPLFSEAEVESLLSVFDQLHWSPPDMGGFSVLEAYTQNDFRRGRIRGMKPVFFAATPYQALMWASREFVGGETARGMRHAFASLDQYLCNPAFRQEELWRSWRDMREGVPWLSLDRREPLSAEEVTPEDVRALWRRHHAKGLSVGLPGSRPNVEPVLFTEDWLQARLASLSVLRSRCEGLVATFLHGVVYAVRFSADDLSDLTGGGTSIAAMKRVPAHRIVAKARVARDSEAWQSERVSKLKDERMMNASMGDGVVAALESRNVRPGRAK